MGYVIGNPDVAAKVIKNLNLALNCITNDIRVRVRKSPALIEVAWTEFQKEVAGFTLMEQPNCCGILISTKTFVHKDYQRHGIGTAMMQLKIAIAIEFGYSLLLATVNKTGNPTEVHILEKSGWKCLYEFRNSRTKNIVGIYSLDLKRNI